MQNDNLEVAPAWTTKMVANYMNVSVQTLVQYRQQGIGPRYSKVGKRLVRYAKVDIDAWISNRNMANGRCLSGQDDLIR